MRDLSSFTDIDRHDFERLPQYFVSLDEKASVRIWLKGGVLVDFRDRELYLLCPNLEPPDPKADKEDERSRLTRWTWPIFGFAGDQALDYIAVRQGLGQDWVQGRKIGLEGLVEVNLCRGPVRQAMLVLAPPKAKTKLLRTAREKGYLAWRQGEDIAAAIARALSGEDETASPPLLTLTANDTAKRLLRQRPRTQQLLLELLGHQSRGQQLKPEVLEQVKGMFQEWHGMVLLLDQALPKTQSPVPQPPPPPSSSRPGPGDPANADNPERRNLGREADPAEEANSSLGGRPFCSSNPAESHTSDPAAVNHPQSSEADSSLGGRPFCSSNPAESHTSDPAAVNHPQSSEADSSLGGRPSCSSNPAESHTSDPAAVNHPQSSEADSSLGGRPFCSSNPAESHTSDPAAPCLYVEPARPYVDPQGEAVLPVYGYRSLLGQMTRGEQLTCRILALGQSVTDLLAQWILRRTRDGEKTALDLQLLAYDPLLDGRELMKELLPFFQPAIARAQKAQLEDADEPLDLLLEWVLHENADPLNLLEPNPSEQMLFTVLGQLPLLLCDLRALWALRQQGGDPAGIDQRLLCRLGELLSRLEDLVLRSWGRMAAGAKAASDAKEAAAAQKALVEAARGPRESRIVVVGAEALPPAHGFVAKTLDDQLVSWNFSQPSFTFLLGDRGKGKSHIIRLVTEILALVPRGLSFLKRPQCPILIEADTISGQGRFEMLQGFFANHDAAQLAYLHHYYQTDARNLAYKRGIMLCHPGAVSEYTKLLPRYMERGLEIRPTVLGNPDLGSFCFEVLLEWAVGGDPDAVYKNMIQSLVAKHGEQLELRHLREAVDEATLRGQTKRTLLALFDELEKMYSPSESIMQHVGDCPVFVVLRGRYLPRNFVNPMQAVLFNAFCRSTANGDPARVVLIEEGLKALCGNRALHEFMVNFQELGRHRRTSAIVAVQHIKGMGKGLWGAADQHVVFGISDPEDWKLARVEHYGMREVPFSEVEAHRMPAGRARVWSRRGNTPALQRGLVVDFRPTLIRAGGETVALEEEE